MRNENGKICGEPHLHKVLKSHLGDEFRFHNLRHTHATLLIESGTPIPEVSERLRHSSASTTLNVYAEATERTHEISVRQDSETVRLESESILLNMGKRRHFFILHVRIILKLMIEIRTLEDANA